MIAADSEERPITRIFDRGDNRRQLMQCSCRIGGTSREKLALAGRELGCSAARVSDPSRVSRIIATDREIIMNGTSQKERRLAASRGAPDSAGAGGWITTIMEDSA